MHPHQTPADILNGYHESCLEVVKDAKVALFWLCSSRLVAFTIMLAAFLEVGQSTCADFVAILFDSQCRLWNLDNLMDKRLSHHVNHTDVPIVVPGHESCLFSNGLRLSRVVIEEGAWDLEEMLATP